MGEKENISLKTFWGSGTDWRGRPYGSAKKMTETFWEYIPTGILRHFLDREVSTRLCTARAIKEMSDEQ